MAEQKIKNILFLNPPDPNLLSDNMRGYAYFEPPLGLLYVYAYMRENSGLVCHFLDLNIEMKFMQPGIDTETVLMEKIRQFAPDMICMAALYYSGIKVFNLIAGIVKKIDNRIIMVVGGHYPTHMSSECLANPDVNYAVLSEGELGTFDLVKAINDGTPPDENEGIAFMRNGELVRNDRKTFWKGFGEHKRLPWEDTCLDYYFREGRNVLERIRPRDKFRIAAITASRGCPNNCTFCASPKFWKRRWRKRNVANIIEEIKYLIDLQGINTVVFNDENIAANRKWFLELLDSLIPLKITWISSGGLSVRSMNDDEVLQKMVDSGIGLFNLAIESGNDKTLARINKPLVIEETIKVVEKIRGYPGSYAIGFFIVGFPFDSWKDVEKTIDFAASLDLDWKSIYCFQSFPGCELDEYCLANGLIGTFNPDYGEVYFASDLRYNGYTGKELNAYSYEANLILNFINNRNLQLGTQSSLEQAERDFKYVSNMSTNHVFCFNGLAEIAKKRGDGEAMRKNIELAASCLEKDWDSWKKYPKALAGLMPEVRDRIQ